MKICLAPMDGITDCAYRIICKRIFEQHGSPDDELMLWTEFMSADGYKHNPAGVIKHILRSDYDHETIAQIFGGNTDTLIHCAVDIEKNYDFAGIELNMGCPSPKIMKCEAGSGMLKDKGKTLEILQEISSQLTTPFSLKTRLGLNQDDVKDQFEFLKQASKYVSMIGVHGRTYKQSHAGFVDRDFIYDLKKELPDTIIIGNGGLMTYEQCSERCGILDGTMPAQGAIGNPWILTPHTPSIQDRYDTIIEHLTLSVACELYFNKAIKAYESTAVFTQPTFTHLQELSAGILSGDIDTTGCFAPVEFRKYLFRYVTGLDKSKELKKNIPPAREYRDLKVLLDGYFVRLLEDTQA